MARCQNFDIADRDALSGPWKDASAGGRYQCAGLAADVDSQFHVLCRNWLEHERAGPDALSIVGLFFKSYIRYAGVGPWKLLFS